METPSLKQFIGVVKYDRDGQMIFGGEQGGQMICDVRGWGAIQQLFKDIKDAEKFQDAMGQFIANAINEKVKRDLI